VKLPSTLGALLVPALAFAQADVPYELDPVVVTATAAPQPQSETLAAVTVIDRAAIERAQATDIAELLRFVPGVELGRNGGPGQVTSVFLRGGESNHTLVLIDGQRINPATAGGAALQNIEPGMIERIEVLRGPRATLYGSDAIAGVINIITRATDGPRLEASIRGGADDTREASLGLGQRWGNNYLSLDAQHEQTDGIPTCANSDLDRGYRRESLNLRAGTQLGGAVLTARFWNAQGNTEYLDSCSSAFGLQPLDQDFRNQLASVEIAGAPLTGLDSRLSLSQMEDRIEQNQPNYLGQYDAVRTRRPSGDWRNTWNWAPWAQLGFGGSVAREEVDALSFGTAIDETRDTRNAYLQQQFDAGVHRLLLAVADAHVEGSGSAVTWNAEYGYQLRPGTRLSASAGTGFRAPDATDRYGFGGNPNLDPERSRSYELGFQQRLSAQQSFELRWFANSVHDLISVEFDPSNDPNIDFGYRAVNIDHYRNQGLEAQYAWTGTHWRASLGGMVQNPEDDATGEALLRRARHSAQASLTRWWGPHSLGLDVLASGTRQDVDADTGAAVTDGGYTLFNLTGIYAITPHWQAQARVENLFDADYQTAAGFRQPGVSGYLGLRYSL
jgi:vitamin B12 transporter